MHASCQLEIGWHLLSLFFGGLDRVDPALCGGTITDEGLDKAFRLTASHATQCSGSGS